MKKQYIKYGTVFCILVILAFLVTFAIYTKNKINEYNKTFDRGISSIDYYFVNIADNADDQPVEALIKAWDLYIEECLDDNKGFYSSITDAESGVIILDSSEYDGQGGSAVREKLNDEARRVCIENERSFSGESSNGGHFQTGVFTSTSVCVRVAGNGDFHVAHCIVGKPFKSVLKANVMTYIIMLLVLLIIEPAIIISFVILYRNQMNYEIRNQKLTRGIAHELKTPLAVTKATVENWDYFDEDRRKDYSKRVVNEVDHMSDMVGKLLDVSKIKEGSSKLNYEAVDLKLLAEDIIDRSKELIRERNITVAFNCDEKPYTVFADAEMIKMVISNFMSNAVKYCDQVIRIQLIRSGRKIEFSITNDGAKIEKKDLDKIWDIFYTTDQTRTDRMSSSGVGLSVVKSILDAHKAEYGCASGDNGTEFKFALPAYEPAGKTK